MIATKPTFTQIKLPQLSMSNLDKWRQSKTSIRSLNLQYDRSCSPPKSKTRTDIVSRGSLSMTPHHNPKRSYYSYKNIVKYDQSFNDKELFNAPQNINKLNSRLKSISKERPQINLAAARDPKNTPQHPYFQNENNDSPLKPIKTDESPTKRNNSIKKRQVKDKIMQIYSQVKDILNSHKGYVRQKEKKQTIIKLVELKKEFKLLNQDYNDFYLIPKNKNFDYQLTTSYDILKKLFESNKQVREKNQSFNIFDGQDLSFHIPTEVLQDDDPNTQLFTESIKEQENEISQSQIDYQQESQYSESNYSDQEKKSTKSGQRVSKLTHRSTKLNIMPIPISNTLIEQEPSSQIRRKSSIKLSERTTPTNQNRSNRFQGNSRDTPPQTPKSNQQSNKMINPTNSDIVNQIMNRQASKRQSKLISRQSTKIVSSNKNLDSQNTPLRQNSQIAENSEFDILSSDRMRYTEDTKSHEVQDQQYTNRDEMLSNAELIDQQFQTTPDPSYRNSTQQKRNTQIFDPVQITDYTQNNSKIQREALIQNFNYGIIQALCDCEQIYDQNVIYPFRINKSKTEWDDDIGFIMLTEFQFQ